MKNTPRAFAPAIIAVMISFGVLAVLSPSVTQVVASPFTPGIDLRGLAVQDVGRFLPGPDDRRSPDQIAGDDIFINFAARCVHARTAAGQWLLISGLAPQLGQVGMVQWTGANILTLHTMPDGFQSYLIDIDVRSGAVVGSRRWFGC